MKRTAILMTLAGALSAAAPADAARIKELVTVEGARPNHLVGVGLVTGLDRTGDRPGDNATRVALANLVRHLGIQISPADVRARNVALVNVTTELPAYAKPGTRLDVTVSSLGSATSLQGGTLQMAVLEGIDGKPYAVAQGQLAIGGFEAESRLTGSFHRKNHVTVARVPNGALVEAEVAQELPTERLRLFLKDPDFTTATRIEAAIEQTLGSTVAEVIDPGVIEVTITDAWKSRVVGLVATIESTEAVPDAPARVIVDERTGTVVAGAGITLGPAAITHGGLEIKIQERFGVSQPQPFGRGDTVVIPETQIAAVEAEAKMVVLPAATTLADVATALNALQVKPRDLITIFQALHAAGALRADVVAM